MAPIFWLIGALRAIRHARQALEVKTRTPVSLGGMGWCLLAALGRFLFADLAFIITGNAMDSAGHSQIETARVGRWVTCARWTNARLCNWPATARPAPSLIYGAIPSIPR